MFVRVAVPVFVPVIMAFVVVRLMRAACFLVVVPMAVPVIMAFVLMPTVTVIYGAARVAARAFLRRRRFCLSHLLRCLRRFRHNDAGGLGRKKR